MVSLLVSSIFNWVEVASREKSPYKEEMKLYVPQCNSKNEDNPPHKTESNNRDVVNVKRNRTELLKDVCDQVRENKTKRKK